MSEATPPTEAPSEAPPAPKLPGEKPPPTVAEQAAGGEGERQTLPERWQELLGHDLRQDPTLGRYKSLDDLARGHLETKRKLSEKGLIPPKDEDPDSVKDEFWNALGRPETPEAYDLGNEEEILDPEAVRELLPSAHKLGLTQKQLQGLLETYSEGQERRLQFMLQHQADQEKTWEEELRKQWGMAYDKKLEAAGRVMKAFAGTAGLVEIAGAIIPGQGRVGNHPAFLNLLAKIAEGSGEHEGLIGESVRSMTKSPEEAQAEITALKRDEKFLEAWRNKRHPAHAEAVDRWNRLHQQAYPEEARAE